MSVKPASSSRMTPTPLTDPHGELHSSSMRNLRLLALVAPLFLLPLACEDSSGSPSGAAFTPEAGANFEAGISPEAGAPETGVDASPPAPLGVTVTVTEDALPKNSVRVILHDAAGVVIGEKTTDATGKVLLAIAPSMVTVLLSRGTGGGSSVSPVSFAGVADGDKLVVAAVADAGVNPVVVGQYSVSSSLAGVAATATDFQVTAGAGCPGSGVATAPVVVDLFAGCLAPKNAVLAYATDTTGLLGYGFAKDVAKPAAGPPPGIINVGPLDYTAPGSTALKTSNAPGNVNANANLYGIANGAGFGIIYTTGTLFNNDLAFQTPTGFAEAYQSVVSFDEYNASSTSTRLFVRREAVPANNILTSADYAAALPRITDAPLTKPTPARPEVTVTSAASLGGADGGVATFHWSNSIAETSGSWTIVVPPSTTTIKIPALPGDAAAFVPEGNVSIDDLIFIEATQLPGYKELKRLPIQPNFGIDLGSNSSKPLPSPGTVRVSRWTPGIPG